MRVVFAILGAIGMVLAAVPARAQTYDPNHPVCLQVFGRIGYYECRITGTMRRLGIRALSTMRAQSVCRECATNGVAPETVSRALLTGVGQAGSRRLYTATAAADLDGTLASRRPVSDGQARASIFDRYC
jgi:hypothetical protein